MSTARTARIASLILVGLGLLCLLPILLEVSR